MGHSKLSLITAAVLIWLYCAESHLSNTENTISKCAFGVGISVNWSAILIDPAPLSTRKEANGLQDAHTQFSLVNKALYCRTGAQRAGYNTALKLPYLLSNYAIKQPNVPNVQNFD
jgi:hypothetical protein